MIGTGRTGTGSRPQATPALRRKTPWCYSGGSKDRAGPRMSVDSGMVRRNALSARTLARTADGADVSARDGIFATAKAEW